MTTKTKHIAFLDPSNTALKKYYEYSSIFLAVMFCIFQGLLAGMFVGMSADGQSWSSIDAWQRTDITLMAIAGACSLLGCLMGLAMMYVVSGKPRLAVAKMGPEARRATLERATKEQLAAVRKRLIEEDDQT